MEGTWGLVFDFYLRMLYAKKGMIMGGVCSDFLQVWEVKLLVWKLKNVDIESRTNGFFVVWKVGRDSHTTCDRHPGY